MCLKSSDVFLLLTGIYECYVCHIIKNNHQHSKLNILVNITVITWNQIIFTSNLNNQTHYSIIKCLKSVTVGK